MKYNTKNKYFCMTIGELPSAYLQSMSYYEVLVWLNNFLSEIVIPTINNNAEAVSEIQSDLKNYVEKDTTELENYTLSSDLSSVATSGNYNDLTNKPDLTNYVQKTDYATSSNAGVVRADSGFNVDTNNGSTYASNLTYANYGTAENTTFISKGTLENVITGKGLTTKAYVDGLVGDINTALDTINGEVI